MDPRQLFVDDRMKGKCVYCGAKPTTRDHVPSRVLLDEPFPDDLAVVDACGECNQGFSIHEEYVACLIECVIAGSVAPNAVRREKVGRILEENARLRTRIYRSCRKDERGDASWEVEAERVSTVVLKLARGHAAFQLNLPQFEEPDEVSFVPLVTMSDEQRMGFESPSTSSPSLWPEIGSRAFISTVKNWSLFTEYDEGWLIVQPDRYRYRVSQRDGLVVHMVLSEYLACRVVWL